MAWRRKRTDPSVTELARIERVLESDEAARRLLGPKTVPVRKRDGTVFLFAAETVNIARELMARKLNPERTRVGIVLAVAGMVLGIGGRSDAGHGDLPINGKLVLRHTS